MVSVNNNLQQFRQSKNLSQRFLADKAGISRQAYSAIESGRSVPSTDVALKLARALGTTVEELFSLGETPEGTISARLVGDLEQQKPEFSVQIAKIGEEYLARPLTGASASVHTLVEGQGIAASTGGGGGQAAVRVIDEEAIKKPTLVLSGCDPSAAFLTASLNEKGVRLVTSERSSRDALMELARGEAHVAGCHLFDDETGKYNTPWVERLVPMPCTVISFAFWKEGIVCAAGNPKGITGISDITRDDISIVNRPVGSGSRKLLDALMQKNRITTGAVKGYRREVRGHMALCETIAAGFADAGIGVEAVARLYGLDFIPLDEERYDLVIPNHFLNDMPVQVLIDLLGRSTVRRKVEALEGYDVTCMGLTPES